MWTDERKKKVEKLKDTGKQERIQEQQNEMNTVGSFKWSKSK